MEKENNAEAADLSQENGGEQSDHQESQDTGAEGQQESEQQQDGQQDSSQDDYRGKLNATNRFLEKEGYEFKGGRWQKKPESSAQGESSEQRSSTSSNNATSSLTREEAVLIAKGYSLDEVEKAKKIAAVEEVDLLKAAESDIFTSWKKSNDEKIKREKAQLGVSRGVKTSAAKKGFGTPGLSDAEHKELFQEKLAK